MSKKQPPNYDVGFERPPRHTQFRKGTSGNSQGSGGMTIARYRVGRGKLK
jgi:hypothetical protein